MITLRRGCFALCVLAFFCSNRVRATPCQDDCSGHGFCASLEDGRGKCTCLDGYFGPSCKNRECPMGHAWVDVTTENEVAHNLARCSNKGTCDFDTGLCRCLPGFEGKACERLTCQCNGHGKCTSMSNFASMLPEKGGPSIPREYSGVWDADMIYGCVCDKSFEKNYDCSQKMICETGDDPLSEGQLDDVKVFRCDMMNQESRKTGFYVCWRGECSEKIHWYDNRDIVEEKLNNMECIYTGGVTVSFVESSDKVCGGWTDNDGVYSPAQIVNVTFQQYFGDLEPLVFVGTQRGTSTSMPRIDLAVRSESKHFDVRQHAEYFESSDGTRVEPTRGTKEDKLCSGRGFCANDLTCECIKGFSSSDGRGGQGSRQDCGRVDPTLLQVTVQSQDGSTSLDPLLVCPGDGVCSLRGVCDPNTFQCNCFPGFKGNDCAEIQCPLGEAWFDLATSTDDGHARKVECSNMGTCDSASGACTCRPGFIGSNCGIMDCPTSACSGHGECLYMWELAESVGMTYGAIPNSPLQWDAKKIKGCKCFDGWEGIDCNERSCPHGDDPLTPGVPEIQKITCTTRHFYQNNFSQPLCFQGPSNYVDVNVNFMSSVDYISMINVPQFQFSENELDDAMQVCAENTWCAAVVQMYAHELDAQFFGTDDEGSLRDNFLVPTDAFAQSDTVGSHSLRMEQYLPQTRNYQTHDHEARTVRRSLIKSSQCEIVLSLSGKYLVSLPANSDLDATTGLRRDTTGDALASKLSVLKDAIESTFSVDFDVAFEDDTLPLCPHGDLGISNALTLTFGHAYGDLPPLQFTPGSSSGLDIEIETMQNSTYEYAECSDEGVCDHVTGLCACFPRFSSSDGRGNRGDIKNCGFKYEEAFPAQDSEGGASDE